MADMLKKGVQKLMECPVCFETPQFTPIYRCAAGHIMCKDCHLVVKICPVCNTAMGTDRCLLAEQILYQLPARCKYSANGCPIEFLDREKLKEHQLECPSRPIRCISIFCKKDVPIQELAKHLKDYHKCGGPEPLPHSGTIFVSEEIFKKDLCWCWMTYFSIAEKNLFSVIARTVGGLWYAWVYISSFKREEYLKYKFTLLSKDQRKIEYQDYCLPVDDFAVDEMTRVMAAAPRLIYDDSIVQGFASKADAEKLKVPGNGNLVLSYYVEVCSDDEKIDIPDAISQGIRSGGDSNCQYNPLPNDIPMIGSKMSMWKL